MSDTQLDFEGNPIKRDSDAYFATIKIRLETIMNFGFTNTVNFTGIQKYVLRKYWERHRGHLKAISDGRAMFIEASRRQIKNLGTNFIRTNRGLIVFRPAKGKKPKIIGKGKKTQLIVDMPARVEVFVPFIGDGDKFFKFVNDTIRDRNPELVMLSVGQLKSREKYTPNQFLRYYQRDVQPIIDEYERRGKQHPFTGLYIIVKKSRKK